MIFDYPDARSGRIHGPAGYTSYESFRHWLRDEFTFRCAYCLKRETWGQVTGEFELDHFQPQSMVPDRKLDYFNLVYACRRCNAVKRDQAVADPLAVLSWDAVAVGVDGVLRSEEPETSRLIRQLDLNSPRLVKWRVMWIRIVELARERDTDLYRQLTSFPDELPNLASLRPPRNLQSEGIELSWFAKRERGQLPQSY